MLKVTYIVSKDALADITDISFRYETGGGFLGERFLNDLYNISLEKICSNPYAFRRFRRNSIIRRFVMKHFPCKIFYDSSAVPIKIIAVIHTSRSSRSIKRRLK